ncbi:MAG: hypothetical protein PHF86_01285 [Candidatus Nanoarchaeia archaeon]|nr:hypothetical protein [Candidatus Nanoarchaeia archaeon]
MKTFNLNLSEIKLRKTKFKFSNNKSLNKFFDDALIESPIKYVRLYEQRFQEIMLVLASWYIIVKIVAYTLLGVAIILAVYNLNIGLGVTLFSFLLQLISKLIMKKFQKYSFSLDTFKSISEGNDFEYLEEIRKDLIETKNLKL